ncbi:host cell division inhibitor Icd-like protein [Escherichia coli]|nr:host cell division inhibitor Icd-like protein [Escherichia coli]EFC6928990.1 host cell division inhibitor Icd-like protein [Escherichia coli]EFO0412815.1 host cell division inhibitor Icd-like protein [Escherichia coli]EHS4182208.1 host cell division inhibitor Icd-like protein [Escherichia coli]EJC3513149.1 host cell division inhibitor Icd-like protein [Escherichia coli]
MCNALTVTKRESAPLPERLCEQITYSTAMFAMWVNFSDKFVQCEGADHRFYSTPEMQNILLQNVVGHTVRKAKNFAGGATDAILSGRQVLINLMSDFVLDKTKATAEDRQWESYILERIANNARFAAGGQCVSFAPMTLCLTEGHYGEYAGLLVGYSCSLTLPCRDVFQVCDPIFVRLYSLRNFSRINAQGANLFDSCSYAIFLRRLFRAGDGVLVDSLLVILCTCKAMRRSSSHHGAGDGYSCSLALRRWRRLISPRMAVTINCASVSFSSLTKFISLKTSRGILAVFCCDLLLVVPVGITGLLTVRWRSVYVEKKIKKGLKCKSPKSSIIFKGDLHLKDKAPQVSLPLAGLLTTNDNDSIEVAMLNHTTHPQGRDSHNLNKYIWRFIALSTAQPRVIHIEATSEQEARQQSPDGCVMVFAARIRQEVRHD